MLNTQNVTTESIDISDLFPEVTPIKETTLFSKTSDTFNVDDIGKKAEVEIKDEPEKETVEVDEKTPEKVKPATPAVSHETFDVDNLAEQGQEEFDQVKTGTKNDLVDFFKAKIESGELVAFDDFDEKKSTLDQYLKGFKKKDFDELWKSNLDLREQEIVAKLPEQYEQSQPEELRYATQYARNGGTDFKGLFKVLAQVEEVKALDPEKDARKINEQYLVAKQFGTDEQIAEQLDQWDDLGVSQKNAVKFKPELDKMEEAIVKQKLDQQAATKQQQVDAYHFYHNSIVEAIKDEDLDGVKIDKKTQSMIYSGLTQDTFVDHQNKRCTEFNYLLDEIMWRKPDYKKLAKVFWLLKDEDSLIKAVSNRAVNKNVEETVRTLKTENSRNKTSGVEQPENTQKRKMIQRQSSLFKR